MNHDRKDNVNPLFSPCLSPLLRVHRHKNVLCEVKYLYLSQPANTHLSDIFVKQNMRVIQNFYAFPIIYIMRFCCVFFCFGFYVSVALVQSLKMGKGL